MKELVVRALKHRRICSVRGCGNRDTVMIARSSDMAGGLFLCRDCAAELYAYYFPMGDKADEAKQEAETAAEAESPVVQSVTRTAPKKSAKSK